MFKIIGNTESPILTIHVTGEMNDRDIERLVRDIHSHSSRQGRLGIVLLLDNYTSFNSAEALYEDLRFVRQCDDMIRCMAIVADESWKETWVALFGLFGGIVTAYYNRGEIKEALHWIQKELSIS